MKLKVCGMKYNPAEVASLGPDYLGFIFWEPSPRHFYGPAPENLDKRPVRAGVFVDENPEMVLQKTREFSLGMVQLHGNEQPEYCRDLQDRFIAQAGAAPMLVKAFPVGPGFNFEMLRGYIGHCDAFLFDSRGPMPGGNGKVFDWSLLEGYPFDIPYFLSGGIGPQTVTQLEAFLDMPVSAYCMALDINSGFETKPGKKDVALIENFMNEAFWKSTGGMKKEDP